MGTCTSVNNIFSLSAWDRLVYRHEPFREPFGRSVVRMPLDERLDEVNDFGCDGTKYPYERTECEYHECDKAECDEKFCDMIC